MMNRTMPWPQQYPQQQQPQQQLISYDSDGGWVREGIDCGAGVPPPSGNGGDGGEQQRYIGGHGSSDGSGGGNSSGGNGDNSDSGVDIGGGDDSGVEIGGGDDGYTLVAGGSDPPRVVEEQQYGRNYAEDDSGPLAGTFGASQEFSADDSIIFPTLGPGLHVLSHPSRHRHALLALSKRRIDGTQWWVGDSDASVHGTVSMDHFYNTRPPTPEESRLIVGTGEVIQVKYIGDLDMVLHCDEDVVVTLREVSFASGLWYELMSFNIIQETEDIVLNKTGAHMLRGRVRFDKEKNENYVQAPRVAKGSRGPPAMVAAVMRPGRQRSMNISDIHYSLGHANDATLRETAKQLHLKLTGHRQYCSGCGEAKAIRAAVPNTTSFRAARPLERLFGDLTGPFSPPAGGARYCMLLMDDYSNVGGGLFLKDKTGSTVTQAFRAFFAAIKPLIAVHGPVGSFRTDNGLEFVNGDFKSMLTELNIKRELTPVDGAKRNGRVERKLALITEGARAAWLEFPRHFPDLQFSRKALIWDKIWLEAFSWMNDCINISARVDDKPDMLCPSEKLYGRRPTSLVLLFMMPGFRHANRKTKMHSKGERYFILNTGHDHSSTAQKVFLASGVASYTADVTFGYHRRPFVGESPTWGDGAVVSSPPSQQQPQLMGAGGGAGAVEHQRARPQQQQRPPHSVGAGGGARAVEYQRARPQQHQRPPHSMGAGDGAGAGEHQRARSQQQQRPPPHSMGAVVGAVAEKTQQQRQSPQQELEPSVVTDGVTAATSATDRWIPAAERPTGDGTISGGGSGVETVAATFTRGQQNHLVVRSSSPGPLQQQRYRVTPAVTRSKSRKQPPGVSRTFTLLAAEEDIARTLVQPDAVFCDSEELPAGPAHLLETPGTYAQAHVGPYDRIWAKAERKEVEGLLAVGTLVEEGGI